MNMEPKRLYRSETNKWVVGICGGLGEYFNVDPVFARIAWLVISVFTGIFPGIIAYILAAFFIPKKPPMALS